jgi:hypothetical protein
MEEPRKKLMKIVFSESLIMLGLIPIILMFFLPHGGFGTIYSSNYLHALAVTDAWFIISPAFSWIGGILLYKSVEDTNSKMVAIWYAIMLQTIWFFAFLFRVMVIY